MPSKHDILNEVKAEASWATREYFSPVATALRWLRRRREANPATVDATPPAPPTKKPCEFFADQCSGQATDIMRCGYCGTHKGNVCGKEGADRSMVTSYLFGSLNAGDVQLAQQLYASGVQPYTVPTGVNQCDGCLQGAPMRGWVHLDKNGLASMYCQRSKYASYPTHKDS